MHCSIVIPSSATVKLKSRSCIDGCLGPSVVIYKWKRDRCPNYPSKGEIITIGGPLLIHELVLEVQHKKGLDVSSGLTLKVLPESYVRSDKTVEKLIAYYQSKPGYEPCGDGSIKMMADTEPKNAITPEEAYQGDYRYARAFPAPAESPFVTNGLEAEEWWPRENVHMGQVAGVAADQYGLVYAFQRGERRWLPSDFGSDHIFKKRNRAIQSDVVLMMDPDSGYVLHSWGAGRFYMPHGITTDHEGNIWLTDVALHQVFKFTPDEMKHNKIKPSLILGERFQPGSDWKHFCQPTDVAVDSNTGNFFVADGYCNSRILKFAPNGSALMEITAPSNPDLPADLRTFIIPHSLALAEKQQLLCVADRENGRILCFNSTTGEYDRQITSEDFGGRVFAIAYNNEEDVLYAVNGPTNEEYYRIKGFTIGLDSGRILSEWTRPAGSQEQFIEPHDIAVYSGTVYVADVGANRVWKFWDEATLSNELWKNQLWKY
ncbi:peptidyl-glycine alpha-amidating monooxygenase B-like [Acanthaster planci]|uniref:Peptidyl-glycine alpha-amidating monooxygenase B-like n=1 Tax=Acanthaster planci TaxID=133434 RepID=A0A8B7ZMF0_ACAPL|nr:peptidyl-glycine alpha-amidating monooxygenase B-like [Acanthaster planci]